MKTFEERYTSWIDGGLEGGALTAFEQELVRRSAAAEARADKAAALQLRQLLREHLHAPGLANADFFSLQVRERLEAERGAAPRPEAGWNPGWLSWLAWPMARMAGLAAAGLFVAGALYYGMMPPQAGPSPTVAAARTAPAIPAAVNNGGGDARVAAASAPEMAGHRRSGDDLLAKNETPAPAAVEIDANPPDLAARVPDPATNTTATPLHYKDANVNVLWTNGLDYMPQVPEEQPASPPPDAPAPAPADAHHG